MFLTERMAGLLAWLVEKHLCTPIGNLCWNELGRPEPIVTNGIFSVFPPPKLFGIPFQYGLLLGVEKGLKTRCYPDWEECDKTGHIDRIFNQPLLHASRAAHCASTPAWLSLRTSQPPNPVSKTPNNLQ